MYTRRMCPKMPAASVLVLPVSMWVGSTPSDETMLAGVIELISRVGG